MASKTSRPANYSDVPSLSNLLRTAAFLALDAFLAPLRSLLVWGGRFVSASAPPTFHILLLFSLAPFLGLSSFGAGLLIRSWIPKGWRRTLYLQYGDGGAPYADTLLPTLSQDQIYDLTLELVLPLFVDHVQLGNFMSGISIFNPNNATLASSARPTLLFPKSYSYSMLTWAGVYKTERIVVPLLEGFKASSYLSSLRARIHVGRHDGWKSVGAGEGRELSVVQAFVHGAPRLTGIRGFFMNHSLLLLALTTASFFVLSSFATAAAYVYFAPPLIVDLPSSPEASRPEIDDERSALGTRRIKAEEGEDYFESESALLTASVSEEGSGSEIDLGSPS